jgi:hypothetical protein
VNLPPELRVPFDALVVAPLVDPKPLRAQVAAHYAAIGPEVARRGALAPERVADLAQLVDGALAAITRKTSPLHVRLMTALALWVLREDPRHPASRERIEDDWRVAAEVVRVVRRPHLIPRR